MTVTNNYKHFNNITVINRETRNIITKIFKTHLTIQYLLSTNFICLNHFHISKIIQYCRGFMQIDKIEWNDLKQAVNNAHLALLILLLTELSLITHKIKRLLPFELPITNRNNTKG